MHSARLVGAQLGKRATDSAECMLDERPRNGVPSTAGPGASSSRRPGHDTGRAFHGKAPGTRGRHRGRRGRPGEHLRPHALHHPPALQAARRVQGRRRRHQGHGRRGHAHEERRPVPGGHRQPRGRRLCGRHAAHGPRRGRRRGRRRRRRALRAGKAARSLHRRHFWHLPAHPGHHGRLRHDQGLQHALLHAGALPRDRRRLHHAQCHRRRPLQLPAHVPGLHGRQEVRHEADGGPRDRRDHVLSGDSEVHALCRGRAPLHALCGHDVRVPGLR